MMTRILHKTWKLSILALLLIASNESFAWRGMRMPELFVKGRYLMAKDINGNDSIVNLHGFGQTYSAYFNGYAWCKDSNGNVKWDWASQHNAANCIAWNKDQIQKMLDRGWMVNWIRLHMDPHWSNAQGKNTTGESDISAFDFEMFKNSLETVFIPMAEYAIENGLYVVMRPPGVCPENIAIGDDYHKYLIKVWTYVCNHEKLKNNPCVMFELANEPVNMLGDDGQYAHWTDAGQKNCTKFFQQIVDEIRATGANNILWVPGLCWQQNYQGYVKYPIKGENLGFAVHCYPGWYGSDSEADNGSVEQGIVTKGNTYADFQKGWDESLEGASQLRPILVTEMDWAPKKYNSSWGKATTGTLGGTGFGANFRYIMDRTGNVSWMLFTDADKLARYKDSSSDGESFLRDPEACPRPCFRWFREYADPNWKFEDTLADDLFFFPTTYTPFNAAISGTGTVARNEDRTHTLTTSANGLVGWTFPKGLSLSQYRYLVLNLAEAPASKDWSLRLFGKDDINSDPFVTEIGSSTQVVVNLQKMKGVNGTIISRAAIYTIGFQSAGDTPLRIKDITLTNTKPESTGIDIIPEPQTNDNCLYNLNGQLVREPKAGQIYISNGRKLMFK